MNPDGGDNGEDLDVERAIFRECAGAAESLARAFRRADQVFPGLRSDARRIARDGLRGLARRTALLIATVGFPGARDE